MATVKQLMNLEGRVSVITGGATGLGLQMAHALTNSAKCSGHHNVSGEFGPAFTVTSVVFGAEERGHGASGCRQK